MDGPFYIYSKSEVIQRYADWVECLPRIKPHYAVKCNNEDAVLKVLTMLGSGFDCASKEEMAKVIHDIGACPSRVVYSHTTKIPSHITYARSWGVDLTTFDSVNELTKLKQLHPTCRLLLRIQCDDEKATFQFGRKFGAEMENVPHLLGVAKKLELNFVGVHFHVGSATSRENGQAFGRAIAKAASIFAMARERFGFQPNLLDMGGGFPGVGTTFRKIAEDINCALDCHFPPGCGVAVIAEPGRYFVQSAFTLVTQIHSVRHAEDNNGRRVDYFINDGIYGSFRDANMENFVPRVAHPPKIKLTRSSVWGPTCCALDVICSNVLLPEMEIGELLLFDNMGAYTLVFATDFNGFPAPKIYQSNSLTVIKNCCQSKTFQSQGRDYTCQKINSGFNLN